MVKLICSIIVRSVLLAVITNSIGFAFGDVMFVTNLSPAGIYSSNLNNDDPLDFTTAVPITLTRPVALDYNPYTSTIYWSDVTTSSIESYSLVTNEHVVLVSSGAVDGIVVDGIGQKLYWTSTAVNSIEVINLDGTARTLLFDMGLAEPRAIELDSINGYLYWTDWGTGYEMIERAKLDDLSTRSQLVTTDIQFPNGLVLSVPDGKMYWCDAGIDVIEEANLDGSSRRNIMDIPGKHPFDIDIYENSLYWTDWNDQGIYSVDISTGIVTIASTDTIFDQPGGIYIHKDAQCTLSCLNEGDCVLNEDESEVCKCKKGYTGPTCKRVTVYCCPED